MDICTVKPSTQTLNARNQRQPSLIEIGLNKRQLKTCLVDQGRCEFRDSGSQYRHEAIVTRLVPTHSLSLNSSV